VIAAGLAEGPAAAQVERQGDMLMPLTHFLGLLALVIFAGALTIWLALYTGVPMVALMFAALAASLILTWTRVSR
jgi:uncharacterized Tic20 family protein